MTVLFGSCSLLHAQNSSAPAPAAPRSATAQAPPTQEENGKQDATKSPNAQQPAENSELVSQDSPATFKVRVNLVLVRVVVRDNQGKVVTNLRREDFQLFDNRKPQAITYFSSETPESQALRPATTVTANEESAVTPEEVQTAAKKLPQRFVGVMFDDVHMSMQDTTVVRDAATRLFGALAPSDRVAMFSASGQFHLQFTADHDQLAKSLYSLVPRPTTGGAGFHDCPEVTYYQADLIQNKSDSQALAIAAEDAVQCAFNGDETKIAQANQMAQSASMRVLTLGDQETEYAYRHIEEAIKQLSAMPGQRVMVFVSPGFIPSTLWLETSDLIDRASHAGIVINTIDARGLYTDDLLGDIADPPRDSPRTSGFKSTYRVAAQMAQDQVLEQLAYGTGGTFFHNRNDLDEGLREAVAAPPLSYLLGFSPQNLKVDGRFHGLKVSLTSKQKYSIQARNGYYAPKTIPNPVEAAKQEIREAIFSQEELHDVPVDLQTQFFKKDATSARLSVLTHFDVKSIHFRKEAGRNADILTIATAIFDDNGNFVTGGEKTVQMKLLDTTYNRLSRSGLTLKSSYDVKPGTYMVRLVVRDGEGSQMAARNGAVVIPN
ncbi:MAG TPA: VWA domain-containing protein [Methylomirabilota bacterium]|nr:VWA domain-containing protein [Methylomirabilota bacterium]